MIQQGKRLSDYPFLIPLYGDIPLFIALFKGEFWIKQYQFWVKAEPVTVLTAIGKLLSFFVTVFAFPVRVLLRYRHGIYSTGWFLAVFTALTLFFFNWADRDYRWTPMYTVWFPIRELYNWVFEPESISWWPGMVLNIRSTYLFWFCMVFCLLAIIHVLVSYFTIKGDERDIRRGIPVLWKLASLVKNGLEDKDRLFVWWLLESVLVGGIGAYFYYGNHDPSFGRFLLYSAACHFGLEAYESIWLSRLISR